MRSTFVDIVDRIGSEGKREEEEVVRGKRKKTDE